MRSCTVADHNAGNEEDVGGRGAQDFAKVAQEHFQHVFSDAAALEWVPAFTKQTMAGVKSGSLVRFRCMVQDPSYGEELHLSVAQILNSATGEVQQRFSQYTDADHALDEGWEVDYASADNVFTEKEVAYCVSVPGETAWAALDVPTSLEQAMEGLSVDGSASQKTKADPNKYPLKGQDHAAALVKFYAPASAPKVSSLIEVVGIYELGYNSRDEDGAGPFWPCIHAIYHSALAPESLVGRVQPNERRVCRDMLQAHLAGLLGGDDLAAHYLLLHLLSKTVSIQGAKVGKFSLNLIGVPDDNSGQQETGFALANRATQWLGSAIAQLVPRAVELPFNLALLNGSRFVPDAEQGDLHAGVLQLAPETELICDESCLHEGTLDERGVRNLHSLQTMVLDQSVPYMYPYQQISIPTSQRVLILSTGKSILQTDCAVHLADGAARFLAQVQEQSAEVPRPLDPMHVEQVRHYLETARHSEFSIPKEISDVISAEYAESRQQAHERGEAMTSQEDLALAVTVARLVSISKGEGELSAASWQEACALEQRRRERNAASLKPRRRTAGSPLP
ncbi:hypothetical protein GGF46_000266 [Coemansia sp. RSA 552]|nr:hypothetical protein GGF46_000266 [Coemansia sp. RSA 552]